MTGTPISPSSASSSLSVLITCLKRAGIDWDGENIADLLWLVSHIDAPESRDLPTETEQESVRIEIDDRAPAPLPEMSPALTLSVLQPEQAKQETAQRSRQGIPFQTPTAPALRKTLPLERSLRPLMRKVDSYTQQVLDETATAEQTAQQQFCMPVMRPARERWLELALVIEDSASSFLWRETIRDFRQVLERQGAFRTVTTWYLQTAAGDGLKLFAQRPKGEMMPRLCSPKELLEASGRRLIFFISDCISPAWREQRLHTEYLDLWAKQGPLVIVQMLPARLWRRTALAEGLKVPLIARFPGAPNSQLFSPAIADGRSGAEPGLKLPVMTLEPAVVSQWARMLAGFGDTPATGIWFEAGWLEEMQETMASAEPTEGEAMAALAEQLVSRFSTTASDTARRLAALMALVPVDLPLVYIIQAKLLPDSTPLHVAEVFLSGLVERVKGGEDESASEVAGSFFSTQRRYDFLPGVRDILLSTVEVPAAEKVLNEISAYICDRINRSSRNFMALLRLKDELDAEGEEFAEFARVTKQALSRLGSEYADLVEDIEQTEVPARRSSIQQIEFPPLEVLRFSKGELVGSANVDDTEDEADIAAFPPPLKMATFQVATISLPQQRLETFEFQTAKIEQERAGIFRRLRWVVKKSRAQARRFAEPLTGGLTLEMVAIPGGRFLMGSPDSEPERFDSEGPQHEVTVPTFFMGRYPVTQAQWRLVANLPQVNRALNPEPSNFKGNNRPVEEVSWYEAVEFCDRLSLHTKRQYRLPTEAEWEYACRAGTTTPFHLGKTLTTEVANYQSDYTYADGPKGEDRGETTPVDEFDTANAFGLCDMHGNVWEWCKDLWHDSYEDAPTNGSAWLTDEDASRLVRGGSWLDFPWYCRSAHRSDFMPDDRFDSLGFRVSCSAPMT